MTSFLTKLETNDGVTKQLDTLRNNKQKASSAPDFVGIEQWLNSEALTIDEPRLYHLVSFDEKKEAILQLNFQTPGTEVFAFTFGG